MHPTVLRHLRVLAPDVRHRRKKLGASRRGEADSHEAPSARRASASASTSSSSCPTPCSDLVLAAHEEPQHLAFPFAAFIGVHAQHDRCCTPPLGDDKRLVGSLDTLQYRRSILTQICHWNNFWNFCHKYHLQVYV